MKYILILILIYSCSFMQSSHNGANAIPRWVYSPYDYCDETKELCATGEADSFSSSDEQAIKNLISVFDVKIKSEFSTSEDATEESSLQGLAKQNVHMALSESIKSISADIVVVEQFNKENIFYSLAKLDREKARALLSTRLTKLDNELSKAWQTKSRTKLRKILHLYVEREKINERLSVASGDSRDSQISYQEIIDWKKTLPVGDQIALRVGQSPQWLTDKLTELLVESGFVIAKGNIKKAISLDIDSIKEPHGGQERYTFSLHVSSFRDGDKRESISVSETVLAKTQPEALRKVKKLFITYLEQNLSELELD